MAVLVLVPLGTTFVAYAEDSAGLEFDRHVFELPENYAGQRLLASSPSGDLFLLQTRDPSALFSLSEEGAELVSELDPPLTAGASSWAVGENGDPVIVRANIADVVVFRGGERLDLEDPIWMVTSVAVQNGDPLVGLAPMRLGGTATDLAGGSDSLLKSNERPPFLVRWNGREWHEQAAPIEPPRRQRPGHVGIRGHEAWLVVSPRAEILFSRRGAYDVMSFEESGALDTRLRAMEGALQKEKFTADDLVSTKEGDEGHEEELARAEELLEKRPSGKKKRIAQIILGIGYSPDDSPVVVSRSSGSFVVDRYSIVDHRVLRCELSDPGLHGTVRATVSPTEGVFLWPARFENTYYGVSWTDLEECDWRETLEVEAK